MLACFFDQRKSSFSKAISSISNLSCCNTGCTISLSVLAVALPVSAPHDCTKQVCLESILISVCGLSQGKFFCYTLQISLCSHDWMTVQSSIHT